MLPYKGKSWHDNKIYLYAPASIDQGHIVCVLCVCLFVFNFDLCYNFCTVKDTNFIFLLVYSTYDAQTNGTKLNDFVTLTLTFALKSLLPPGGGHSVSQTHLVLGEDF